jgi:hypothetical protein
MPKIEVNTKFYRFDQNNSGGDFRIDDEEGIGPLVWIEALNKDHANLRAEELGIYFNGCQKGRDCSCCGDRWTTQWDEEDGKERPVIDGKYDFHWHNTVYVHGLDGSIGRIRLDESN